MGVVNDKRFQKETLITVPRLKLNKVLADFYQVSVIKNTHCFGI